MRTKNPNDRTMLENDFKKAILKTIENNKEEIFELVNEFYRIDTEVSDVKFIKTVLHLLENEKQFAEKFTEILLKTEKISDYRNADWSELVTQISGAAGGMLNGYYTHKTSMQQQDFTGQMELLTKEKKSDETMVYVAVAGLIITAVIISAVVVMRR